MFCLTRILWFPLGHFHFHEIFSHHLSICVAFALNWVSCRQHNVGSHLLTQSATLCILIGMFHPLTFKVIINWYVFIAILSPAFPLIFKFLPCPPLFLCGLNYFCIMFFLVFVNLLYAFNLWLPCFSSMYIPYYILPVLD